MREINAYPLTNCNFLLRVEGMYDIPCKSVAGIHRENEYEYIQEGGVNDYVHIRRKPSTKPGELKAEWYAGMYDLEDILFVGKCFQKQIQVFVSRYPGIFDKPDRTYNFTGCVITGKEYGELSAEEGRALTETITIAYQEMNCVDNENPQKKEVWKFKGKDPKGNGKRQARKVEDYGIKENPVSNARQWPKTKSAKTYLKKK